jgi:hypothetical protein
MKRVLPLLLIYTLVEATAQDTSSVPKIPVHAVRVQEQIVIDGILSESVWQNEFAFTDFKQSDPNQGSPATERTEVRVAYDDAAIYVGARMYDVAPDSIMQILSRRDQYPVADWIGVYIDGYHDHRTGYVFALSAGGTILDGVLYNDDWNDLSWDGVWQGKTHIDDKGWSAEIRIPYSQIRFHDEKAQVWGINFQRDIGRRRENDMLAYTPRSQSGFVSRFGELVGLENIDPPRRFEVMPYITGKGEYTHPSSGNPFNSGSRYSPGAGADIKVGMGNNLTMNATVNPDFGQVEVDPAVVNLSDVESFFEEKRPFFLEGATIFNFGQGGARNYWGFNWPGPSFFYSRRIGRAPQGSVPDADFTDVPQGAHILGAAKLTGKIVDGWNFGTIQAVTGREMADLDTAGHNFRSEVEPAAYYGIIRAQKDFNDGRQGLGFISTTSARRFSETRLRDDINNNSEVFGLDGWTFLDEDKVWVISGWAGLSRVEGDRARMVSLQRNSQHYFQRPDAPYLSVDSSATSMSGYGMRLWLNKNKGHFFSNSAIGILSPSFDVNDVGFQYRSNIINMHVGGGYSWSDPGEVFRYAETGGAVFQSYDYDGNVVWRGVFQFGSLQFLNYYNINWNLAYNPQTINTTRTRGGPLMLNPPGYQVSLDVSSDSRKSLEADVNAFTYQSGWQKELQAGASVTWRPLANVSLSIGPSYDHDREAAQWVTSADDLTAIATFGKRYIFADLDQHTLSANIRLNWTFSPTLSLQLFLQPLISSGKYTNFKELTRPRSFDFEVYGTGSSALTETESADGSVSFSVDPDGNGPASPITFDNPDFNTKSLRGNAVLRWEYMPGSVVYFVWTQSRYNQTNNDGNFQFNNSVDRLFSTQADNIFLVKFSYWFNM